MTEITAQTFKELVFNYEEEKEWKYLGDKPCLIDFYADWCQPCKMMNPILEEVEKNYEGKINIYKVNTENQSELSQVFGIRSIPSLLFIPLDESPQMATGVVPLENMEKIIEEVLKV